MEININKFNGGQSVLKIIYAYEFNKETVVCKLKDKTKTLICFIVEDNDKNELQEYYYDKEKPNVLWWHNVFFAGTFEKKIKLANEGDTFKHQKDAYLWRKLTANEIAEIINNKIFVEEI